MPPRWGHRTDGQVAIDIGHGIVNVVVGSPFQETVERVAADAHYGGYFRVFLNDHEVIDPSDAPATIDAGMRIAITSYDKVG